MNHDPEKVQSICKLIGPLYLYIQYIDGFIIDRWMVFDRKTFYMVRRDAVETLDSRSELSTPLCVRKLKSRPQVFETHFTSVGVPCSSHSYPSISIDQALTDENQLEPSELKRQREALRRRINNPRGRHLIKVQLLFGKNTVVLLA